MEMLDWKILGTSIAERKIDKGAVDLSRSYSLISCRRDRVVQRLRQCAVLSEQKSRPLSVSNFSWRQPYHRANRPLPGFHSEYIILRSSALSSLLILTLLETLQFTIVEFIS